MRRHKRPLPPELIEPFFRSRRSPGVIWDDNRRYGHYSRLIEAFTRLERKADALYQFYSIDRNEENAGHRLAMALADDYIPGFRWEGSPGAPTKWGRIESKNLREAVERRVATGLSAMDACRELLVAPKPDQGFPQARTLRSLYRRYQEAKKKHLK